MGCRSPLPLHCVCPVMALGMQVPRVAALLSIVGFSAKPCAVGAAWVSSAGRGLGQSPCSRGKATYRVRGWCPCRGLPLKINKGRNKKWNFAWLWLRSQGSGLPQRSDTAWAFPCGASGNALRIRSKAASPVHVVFGSKLWGKLGPWTVPGQYYWAIKATRKGASNLTWNPWTGICRKIVLCFLSVKQTAPARCLETAAVIHPCREMPFAALLSAEKFGARPSAESRSFPLPRCCSAVCGTVFLSTPLPLPGRAAGCTHAQDGASGAGLSPAGDARSGRSRLCSTHGSWSGWGGRGCCGALPARGGGGMQGHGVPWLQGSSSGHGGRRQLAV